MTLARILALTLLLMLAKCSDTQRRLWGQDGILRAGWQPALYGPFCKLRQAGYQPAAGCQPAPQAAASVTVFCEPQ